MTTPPTDRPLTAGDIPLLREGVSLRVVFDPFVEGGKRYEAALASQPSERERELEGALRLADAAIKEWFRYLHGGEMRGSYDGKPERDGLRKAGYAATRALTAQPAGEPTHG